jgi:molybdate transport system regulatory protein
MKISARNQLKGTIVEVTKGAVNGIVKIDLGQTVVTSDITNNAIDELGLEVGKEAYAVVKATSVMFAPGNERVPGISARNQIAGDIVEVTKGAVNGHIGIKIESGAVIKGSITNAAIDELGFEVGNRAVAIVKSTDVMVAVD